MTSSILGSIGAATESNYCSANYFLDIFARYRQSLGLPGMSVGLGLISEVGYLHENPDIEALLVRKGLQPIDEDELIQIIDIALSASLNILDAYDSSARSHILTGLEMEGFIAIRKKGFKASLQALDDPRVSILASALDRQGDLMVRGQEGSLIADIANPSEEGRTLANTILTQIAKQFSSLVYQEVDCEKPLIEYGMDSIIATQFRTWFFKQFQVDIPFLELLSNTVTLSSLSSAVLARVDVKV